MISDVFISSLLPSFVNVNVEFPAWSWNCAFVRERLAVTNEVRVMKKRHLYCFDMTLMNMFEVVGLFYVVEII
jgi:hypothetical protein